MAGSLKNYIYTDDAGVQFAIKCDESNIEAVNGSTQAGIPLGTPVRNGLPRNMTPRCVFYSSADGNRIIKCVVLTAARYAAIAAGTVAQSIADPLGSPSDTLDLIRFVGEKVKLYRGGDTGLNDGDIP